MAITFDTDGAGTANCVYNAHHSENRGGTFSTNIVVEADSTDNRGNVDQTDIIEDAIAQTAQIARAGKITEAM